MTSAGADSYPATGPEIAGDLGRCAMAVRREVVHGTMVVLIGALCAGCASNTMLQRGAARSSSSIRKAKRQSRRATSSCGAA